MPFSKWHCHIVAVISNWESCVKWIAQFVGRLQESPSWCGSRRDCTWSHTYLQWPPLICAPAPQEDAPWPLESGSEPAFIATIWKPSTAAPISQVSPAKCALFFHPRWQAGRTGLVATLLLSSLFPSADWSPFHLFLFCDCKHKQEGPHASSADFQMKGMLCVLLL